MFGVGAGPQETTLPRGLQMIFQADLPNPNTFAANCG
jgi:hypothetical protein